MRKSILFTFILMLFVSLTSAQTVVLEENFDSYEVGYNLAEAGFILWEGDASVVTGDAVSGDKYAELKPTANNYYFRRNFTLEEGKDYVFEVQTRSPEAKKHRAVAKFGTETVQGEVIESTFWTKTSIPFSVTAGNTEVILWIYSYPNFVLHADDFVLYEATTGVANIDAAIFSVRQSQSGLFHVEGAENLTGYEVFDTSGRVIMHSDALATNYDVNIASFSKGMYILKVRGESGLRQTRKLINY
jgi:hypothetical protein